MGAHNQLVPFAGTGSILTAGKYFYIQEDKVDEKGDNSEACELEAAMKADDEAARKAEEETAPKTETGSKYCFRLLCEHDQVRFSHRIYKVSRMTETGSKYCFRLLCQHDQVRLWHRIYKMSRMTRDRLKIASSFSVNMIS